MQSEPWGVTDLDTSKGHVLIRQDWRYDWNSRGATAPWTPEEQRAYHHSVDHLIWAYWSFWARIMVVSTSRGSRRSVAEELVSRFPHVGLTLSFDIRKVSGPFHWRAKVTKVDPKIKPLPRAEVRFQTRELQLYNIDTMPHRASRYVGVEMERSGNRRILTTTTSTAS